MCSNYVFENISLAKRLLQLTLRIKPERWFYDNHGRKNPYFLCGDSNNVWCYASEEKDTSFKGNVVVYFRKHYNFDMDFMEVEFLSNINKYAFLTKIKEQENTYSVTELKWRPFN